MSRWVVLGFADRGRKIESSRLDLTFRGRDFDPHCDLCCQQGLGWSKWRRGQLPNGERGGRARVEAIHSSRRRGAGPVWGGNRVRGGQVPSRYLVGGAGHVHKRSALFAHIFSQGWSCQLFPGSKLQPFGLCFWLSAEDFIAGLASVTWTCQCLTLPTRQRLPLFCATHDQHQHHVLPCSRVQDVPKGASCRLPHPQSLASNLNAFAQSA